MRHLAIAQQRDRERFCHVHEGGHAKPKALFRLGDFAMLKQPRGDTLDPPVRPHILRVVKLRDSGMAVLQGIDGATISHQVAKSAQRLVFVADSRVYPET